MVTFFRRSYTLLLIFELLLLLGHCQGAAGDAVA
jgi:hypothetical protein